MINIKRSTLKGIEFSMIDLQNLQAQINYLVKQVNKLYDENSSLHYRIHLLEKRVKDLEETKNK